MILSFSSFHIPDRDLLCIFAPVAACEAACCGFCGLAFGATAGAAFVDCCLVDIV
jgi:hypothetical protein